MDVKVVPKTKDYYDNFDRIFRKDSKLDIEKLKEELESLGVVAIPNEQDTSYRDDLFSGYRDI